MKIGIVNSKDLLDKKINPHFKLSARAIFKNKKIAKCPLGGDKNDCENCVYNSDYEWNKKEQDCIRRKK